MGKLKHPRTTTIYVCGVCKKEGHNKRTCQSGKVNRPNDSLPTPKISLQPQPDVALTKSNLVGRWDDYIQKVNPQPSQVGNGGTEESGSNTQVAAGEYSLEELETYWILKNGEDGKRKRVHIKGMYSSYSYQMPAEWEDEATEELFTFVNSAYKEAPHTKTMVWSKFFKTFGVEARYALLRRYNYLTEYARKKGARHNSTPLPLPFFAVFAKDSSKTVREMLAKTTGLPVPVAKILLEDKDYDVRLGLALNTSPNMEQILSQLYSQVDGLQSGQDDANRTWILWQRDGRYHALKRNLARNPRTPTEVLYNILLRTDKDLGIKMSIYSNPNAPTAALRKRWKTVYTQLNPTPKTVTHERAIHYFGTNGIYYRGVLTEVASLAAGGHIEDSEVRKFLDSEMEKIEYQRKNNINIGLFLENNFLRTLQNTPLTEEKLTQYYTAAGGAEHANLQLLTSILQQKEVPSHIVEECLQRTPPTSKSYHYEQFEKALTSAEKKLKTKRTRTS